jgi:hypothetical protein
MGEEATHYSSSLRRRLLVGANPPLETLKGV